MFVDYPYPLPENFDACGTCAIKSGTDTCRLAKCRGGYFVEDNFKEQIKEKSMNKNVPHKFAETIKAWADGAVIETRVEGNSGDFWRVTLQPKWDITCEYRVQPEKEYPKTSLSGDELRSFYDMNDGSVTKSCRDVADAAIAHFIKNDMEAYIQEHAKKA